MLGVILMGWILGYWIWLLFTVAKCDCLVIRVPWSLELVVQIIIFASARIVLQYSVCKWEVESTGKWSKISVLFNQPHSNLVPRV
jgi:uncharacterized membrane protein YjfL (UPF0719 family)